MYSLLGLCDALAGLPEVDLRILTTDTAGPQLAQRVCIEGYPTRYPPGYEVWFTRRRLGASFAPRMYAELPAFIRWADVVHLTAVYSSPTLPTLCLCRALKKPLVWSPRGSLQRWTGTSNRVPKWIWESIAGLLSDPARMLLHCTSPEEAEASTRRIRLASVIIPNGVETPQPRPRLARTPGGALRVLYLGRIHSIKALDQLIAAVGLAPRGTIELTVAGSGDADLLTRLKALGLELGLSSQLRFVGHVEGEAKEELFDTHDILVLPSHRENFGMVVAEALSRGVPVIVSRGTPWKAAEERGCGLWVANDPASLYGGMTRMASADLENMGAAGRSWMSAEFSWNAVAQRMLHAYRELICNANRS